MTDQSSYKGIFKSTILFSFVTVFQILIGIIKNKVIAVFLGAEGIGMIGILSNSIQLLQSSAGLGINQSAVRDISEANGSENKARFSRIISLTNKIILFTCLLGCLLTIVLSPLLSEWTFGDKNFTVAYLWLAFVVGINILTEGQLAILKGMRQLRALAKASIMGSIVGLVTAVPLYYFIGKSGIVPSLILTAISSFFFSNFFVKKIEYNKTKVSLKEISSEALPMIKMGVALMYVGFLGLLLDLIIASYIRSHSSLEVVGYYRAGTTIISTYFAIILTSMTTDYYPRISAIHNDNVKLQIELNKQSDVSLILIFPIAVLFVFLSPTLIQILYSKEFIQTILYTDYAILGTIIIVCSNSLGMILLAKQNSKIFLFSTTLQRVLMLIMSIFAFNSFGLLGLGISYLIMAVVHLTLMSTIMNFYYDISFSKNIYVKLLLVVTMVILALFARQISNTIVKYSFGTILFISSSIYSYMSLKKNISISFIEILKRKK